VGDDAVAGQGNPGTPGSGAALPYLPYLPQSCSCSSSILMDTGQKRAAKHAALGRPIRGPMHRGGVAGQGYPGNPGSGGASPYLPQSCSSSCSCSSSILMDAGQKRAATHAALGRPIRGPMHRGGVAGQDNPGTPGSGGASPYQRRGLYRSVVGIGHDARRSLAS
jgi:hypothetical protein